MPAAPVTPTSKNPLKGAVEILSDRLYFVALKTNPTNHNKVQLRSPSDSNKKLTCHFFCIDNELVYWNFFLDFGPLNLGQLYRFCMKLNMKLESDEYKNCAIIFYSSSTQPAKRSNAIFLICAWQILYLHRTPEDALYGFSFHTNELNNNNSNTIPSDNSSMPPPYPLTSIGHATVDPLPPFHDASPCVCTYDLTILHCLQGLRKAKQLRFFDWSTFDVQEYEYYEQVENGDLNWIIQDRIMAFAGPSYKKTISPEGYCTLAPSDYIPYFRRKQVALVVRLNKKAYDEQEFIRAGISHLEQFYVDGSCPPMKILRNVLNAFEAVPKNKAFAIHCKAGLGRTGTCIGAYMMKHYKFTAAECIAWMRICRPGCVIGPQQHFLQDLEHVMWQEGDIMRNPPSSGLRNKKSSSSNATKSSNSTGKKKSIASHSTGGSRTTESSNSRNSRLSKKIAKEAVVGRAGQADGLLARRHQQHQHQHLDTTHATTSSSSSSSSKRKPVTITPDSTASSAKSSSKSHWGFKSS